MIGGVAKTATTECPRFLPDDSYCLQIEHLTRLCR